MDLEGFEPSTSSVRLKHAPNCATGPSSCPESSAFKINSHFMGLCALQAHFQGHTILPERVQTVKRSCKTTRVAIYLIAINGSLKNSRHRINLCLTMFLWLLAQFWFFKTEVSFYWSSMGSYPWLLIFFSCFSFLFSFLDSFGFLRSSLPALSLLPLSGISCSFRLCVLRVL